MDELNRGDVLTIQTDLINVEEDAQLWGEQYSGSLAEAERLQETISRQIADKLRVKLTSAEKEELAKRPTENPEAYQLYLKGRFYWNKRRVDHLETAIDYFKQAIDKDPGYALAYAGLAGSYALIPEYGLRQTRDFLPQAESAVERAIALDPNLAESHAVLGLVKMDQWHWTDAEAEFKQAIALNPNYPSTHQWYSILLRAEKRFAEAEAEILRAQELDPLSSIIGINVGINYRDRRQYDRAVAEFKKVLALDPDFTYASIHLAFVDLLTGGFQEAITELKKLQDTQARSPLSGGMLIYAYARSGDRKRGGEVLRELLNDAKQGQAVSRGIALGYLGLNNTDGAIEWLGESVKTQEPTCYYTTTEPIFVLFTYQQDLGFLVGISLRQKGGHGRCASGAEGQDTKGKCRPVFRAAFPFRYSRNTVSLFRHSNLAEQLVHCCLDLLVAT